jgi:hypothetical protein
MKRASRSGRPSAAFRVYFGLHVALAGPPNYQWLLDEELGNKDEDQAGIPHSELASFTCGGTLTYDTEACQMRKTS